MYSGFVQIMVRSGHGFCRLGKEVLSSTTGTQFFEIFQNETKKVAFLAFVMGVTGVLLFCYCEQCIISLAEFHFFKELSVSHESYYSDDFFGTCSVWFFERVECST
jgi:hypothetical protein